MNLCTLSLLFTVITRLTAASSGEIFTAGFNQKIGRWNKK
jgi:hypothetical protein